MTDPTQLETTTLVETTQTVADRRRPGRVDDVSPELIPLLRKPTADTPIEFDEDEVDQTAAIRGVFFGVLISAPIWAAIAYVGSRFLSN